MPTSKLTADDRLRIVSAYRSNERLRLIAERHGVTRQTVHAVIRQAGVGLREKAERRECAHCGKALRVRLYRAERTAHSYCGQPCYVARIRDAGSGFEAHRQGQRRGRAVVGVFYPLAEGNVVHHIDGDQANNDVGNLMVFRSQADHMRWHRAGLEASGVVPLWRGDRG